MSIRIAVEFTKMTNNKGISETVVAIPFINTIRYFPDLDHINKLIPEIENEYNLLVQSFKENSTKTNQNITIFFEKTCQNAIIGLGLINYFLLPELPSFEFLICHLLRKNLQ